MQLFKFITWHRLNQRQKTIVFGLKYKKCYLRTNDDFKIYKDSGKSTKHNIRT